jgi:hypothetical protein
MRRPGTMREITIGKEQGACCQSHRVHRHAPAWLRLYKIAQFAIELYSLLVEAQRKTLPRYESVHRTFIML